MRNGKGVIVYPNPLVADLMAAGIADRIAVLQNHHVVPNAAILDALWRLERELDAFAIEVKASADFLQGRGLAGWHSLR